MNDYTEYPLLMWMLTSAVLTITAVGALIPLLAGIVSPTKRQDAASKENV